MEWTLLLLITIVAFLYASVGHGGASGYLALMALFSVAPETMKSTALIMNLAVSALSFYQYYRAGYFNWKLFYPFALASIPLAFVGSLLTPEGDWYKIALGLILLVPSARMLGFLGGTGGPTHMPSLTAALISGALIGFVSGMIGVGGGILLSPLMILMHWGDLKHTAAVSSLFIFVNSASALAAMTPAGIHLDAGASGWLIAAIAGGLAGSWLGSRKMDQLILKRILGVVLIIASAKLLGV